MEILYIFGAVLGAATILFNWDKLRNNDKISKSIDSVKNTCILTPFHFLTPCLLTLPRKTWIGLKSLVPFIFQKTWNCIKSAILSIWNWFDSWPRPLALFVSSFVVLVLYIYACHKKYIHDLIPQEADKAIYNTLIPILLGAIPAFFIWKWRNYDKKIDQYNTKWDLKTKDADLKLRIVNNDWDNFLRFQDIALNDKNEEKRDTAIRALGVYYDKEGDFPKQVHQFFRSYLEKYWKAHNTETHAPLTIQAIYDVINKHKLFLNREGDLTLTGFNLTHYLKAIDGDFSNSFFVCAKLDFATSFNTNLSNSILAHASLYNANLYFANLCGANLEHTVLIGTILDNIQYDDKTKWESAIYLDKNNIENFKGLVSKSQNIPYTDEIIASIQETIFPVGFNPRDHKMIEICDFHKLHGLPHTLKVFNKA